MKITIGQEYLLANSKKTTITHLLGNVYVGEVDNLRLAWCKDGECTSDSAYNIIDKCSSFKV